jgi:predicted ATPase
MARFAKGTIRPRIGNDSTVRRLAGFGYIRCKISLEKQPGRPASASIDDQDRAAAEKRRGEMDPRCRIELLGELRVQQGERTITRFRTRQTGALLAYLAYHLGRHLPREVLIEAIWPDAEARTGRNNLRIALHSLRSQLEPAGVPAGAVLQADRFAVGLNTAAVVTDVAGFLAALQQAEMAKDNAARNAALRQAIDLYPGELLPGFYDDWVLDAKDRLQALYEQAQEDWQEGLAAETPSRRASSAPAFVHLPAVTAAAPPPPRADAPTQNVQNVHLPLPFTNFFGREEELALLKRWVGGKTDSGRTSPLLTLTGPGGSGKTRLAIEAARHMAETFAGGIWFVSLQDLSDPRLIPGAIVDALHLPRSPQVEPLHQVVACLNDSGSATLLVLDNLEHLLAAERRKAEDGAAVVRALLERCPALTCLVTSRQRLDLEGERELPVPPLPVPGSVPSFTPEVSAASERPHPHTPEHLMQFASVQLFVDRAQSGKPDFQITVGNATAIGQLCDRLEGIPLALELAARRALVMTPKQMLFQLDQRLDFLVSRRRDVVERHRTLRAAIEWSYRLLSPGGRRFFCCLSVFRGGWMAEAAEAVCEEPQALDYLAQLRECSLIVTEDTGLGMRFRMLETLREFAQECLTEQEHTALQGRHLQYFLDMAEAAAAYLGRTAGGEHSRTWLDRLEADYDNLRAALEWSLATQDSPPDAGMRLACALQAFWNIRFRYHWQEGRQWLERALDCGAAERTSLRARTLEAAGWHVFARGDFAAARSYFEQGLAIGRELQDKTAIAWALNGVGFVSGVLGDTRTARALYEECLSLFREVDDRRGIALALMRFTDVADTEDDAAINRVRAEESLAIAREVGDMWGIADALRRLGRLALEQGDGASACALWEDSLALWRALGHRQFIVGAICHLAEAYWFQGDRITARCRFEEAVAVNRGFEVRRSESPFNPSSELGLLRSMGQRVLARGEFRQAGVFFRESLEMGMEWGDRLVIAQGLKGFADLAAQQGRFERVPRLLGAAEALCETAGRLVPVAIPVAIHRAGETARVALDEETFAAAWSEGRALTLEQAIAFALEGNQLGATGA